MVGSRWAHTGAILAGGQSTRFGSPKHSLTLANGDTFLESVARRLGEVCSAVVIVGSVQSDSQQIPDLRQGHGPLGGIEALLASGLDTEYLVCPVDMPLMPTGLLRRLTESAGRSVTIFAIDGSDQMETLPARIASSALPQVTATLDAGRPALHHLWAQLRYETVLIPSSEAQALFNVNTIGDYTRLHGTDLR